MKRIVLLFLCISSAVFSQNLFREGEIAEKKYLEIIDFEIVKGKIIVPVVIKGETYRFLLDTGAPNIISERLFEELNTEIIQKTLISDANKRVDTMTVVGLPKLELGRLSFENTTALVSDLHGHQLLQCHNIDGFIGSNLFKNTVIKISLQEKKLYITDKVKNLQPKTKGIKLQLIGGQAAPYVKIIMEGNNKEKATEVVLVDTGMEGLYDISNRAFGIFKNVAVFSNEIQGEGTGGIGIFGSAEKEVQHQITIPKFGIGKAVFLGLSAHTMNDNNSRVGLDLLKYGDIILDFKKKKFYFENTSEIQLNPSQKISYTYREQNFIVDFVWDEQLKGQIQHGDKVTRIDNLNVKDMDICEMLTLKEYVKSKNTYEIEVLNSNNELITIKL